MNKKLLVKLTALSILSLTGCAAPKLAPPESGPKASLEVRVTNFKDIGMFEAENVWVSLYNKDESWGGERVLVESHPSDSYIIPAEQEINFSLYLQKSGPGYSSGCTIPLDLNVSKNSNLKADFAIKRNSEGEGNFGCIMTLSNDDEVIGEYEGQANLTIHKVKVIVQ